MNTLNKILSVLWQSIVCLVLIAVGIGFISTKSVSPITGVFADAIGVALIFGASDIYNYYFLGIKT